MNSLQRFIDAQEREYQQALGEIKNGRKHSHWIWYIFPQIDGLGFSETAKFYAIKNIDEAKAYLQHAVLGKRLVEISKCLLEINNKSAREIMGEPDDLKLRSCMTLFGSLENTDPVFQQVIDKFFNGEKDSRTTALIKIVLD